MVRDLDMMLLSGSAVSYLYSNLFLWCEVNGIGDKLP